MKISLFLGAVILISVFFQKQTKRLDFNFPDFQPERNFEIESNFSGELQQKNKVIFFQADGSQKSLYIIFHFIKTTLLPIVGVAAIIWLIMFLGIFNSLIKMKK